MNMSYCRFENTLKDLKDCYKSLSTGKELSEDEESAKRSLIDLCKLISDNFSNKTEEE